LGFNETKQLALDLSKHHWDEGKDVMISPDGEELAVPNVYPDLSNAEVAHPWVGPWPEDMLS
jgi:hypothetical protein